MNSVAPQPLVRPRLPRRRAHGAAPRGFTLMETAMATVIIGVAFTAMLQLLAAGTVANREGTELTTAINLANNIHEAAIRKPYVDLFDLDGLHDPAIDGEENDVVGMPGWTQLVDVSYVDHNRVTLVVPDTQKEPTSRITVTVRHKGKDVYRASWIAAASE